MREKVQAGTRVRKRAKAKRIVRSTFRSRRDKRPSYHNPLVIAYIDCLGIWVEEIHPDLGRLINDLKARNPKSVHKFARRVGAKAEQFIAGWRIRSFQGWAKTTTAEKPTRGRFRSSSRAAKSLR